MNIFILRFLEINFFLDYAIFFYTCKYLAMLGCAWLWKTHPNERHKGSIKVAHEVA